MALHSHNTRVNLPKFIWLTTTTGRKRLVNVDHLTFTEDEGRNGTFVLLRDSKFEVRETLQEIFDEIYR
jgi:hypothetical protein